MSHNYKDWRGVTHAMRSDGHATAYNATTREAECGVGLLAAAATRETVDCMTCLVRTDKGK